MAAATQKLSDAQVSLYTDVSGSANSFALQVYKEVSKNSRGSNVIISPLSLQVALALTYSGAVGETAKEIATLLNIPNDKKRFYEGYNLLVTLLEDPVLHIATRMFIEKTFGVKEEYNRNALTYFKADGELVDFSKDSAGSRRLINNWVEKKTNNKIKDLIPADFINPDTVMILINAVHFKADWQYPFRTQATTREKFYITENDFVDVDMMHLTKELRYSESSALNSKILELPYAGNGFSMFIILPNEITGLLKLEEALINVDLNEELSNLWRTEVIVSLPKFELTQTVDLKSVLQSLGVKTMFGESANFSEMTDSQVSVSKVIQKAFISVDEKGTEAAAATEEMISSRSLQLREEFIADHPFLFLISKKIIPNFKIVTFIGRIENKN